MTKLPSITGERLVRALKRAGFIELRQKGSHVSLEKRTPDKVFRTVVPQHQTLAKGTLIRHPSPSRPDCRRTARSPMSFFEPQGRLQNLSPRQTQPLHSETAAAQNALRVELATPRARPRPRTRWLRRARYPATPSASLETPSKRAPAAPAMSSSSVAKPWSVSKHC
jgi:predicted RNA binding protein YcfA (HicA-like mRNA interferase family)